MIIKNLKETISSNEKCLEILKYSHWEPTREKILKLVKKYRENESIYTFGSFIGNNISGVIVIRRVNSQTYEIVDISIEPKHRNKGIASKLIDFIIKTFNIKTLFAETDDDAVGFYKKYGFEIEPVKRKDCLRYKCLLNV